MAKTVSAALHDDRFIALLLDESTDAGNISQLVVHYRISHYGDVVQMFGALIPMGVSHNADAILTLVRQHLKGTNRYNSQCVCVCLSCGFARAHIVARDQIACHPTMGGAN